MERTVFLSSFLLEFPVHGASSLNIHRGGDWPGENAKLSLCPPNSTQLSRQRETTLVHPLCCCVSHWPKPSPRQQQPQPNHQGCYICSQMSSWGICSSHVTSCAEILFQRLHCPHQSGLALLAFLSRFTAAQSCWEKQSRDASGKKIKINSSHTSHMNSFFLKKKKLLNLRRKTPDCEL